MDDADFKEVIKTYDLATLRAARSRLDVTQYAARAAWLDETIRQREGGIPALPAPGGAAFRISRREGYAGFLYRLPALVIDLLLVYLPLGMAMQALIGRSWLWPLLVLPVAWPLYTIVTTAHSGRTAGQWLMGLMVIDATGAAITLRQSFMRRSPDVVFAAATCVALLIALLGGLTLPEHGTTAAKVSAFHYQFPWWDRLDDAWDVWIWSEILLLCLDARRRSLAEFFSHTWVVHEREKDRLPAIDEAERSWYDWLLQLVSHRRTLAQ